LRKSKEIIVICNLAKVPLIQKLNDYSTLL
jgi:hypothetical protein